MDGSIDENMVRQWITDDLERYPEHRPKAAAIDQIVILPHEDISPITYAEEIRNRYLAQMEANSWEAPEGLHIFEAVLGPGVTVYVAYGI
jgi:hypothetical protein